MICMKMNCRALPFVFATLFSLVFIMPVFVFNQTLVWDDWVWVHSSNEQLRDVAIQLGFWWLADLNVFIYTFKNPNIFLSAFGFFSHVVSIAVLGRFLIRFNVFNGLQLGFWAACCILSPFVVIRYINSVAFYNLYFACFILAAYVFVVYENKWAKLLSALLFLVSFSLSSLVLAYLVFILFSDEAFLDGFVERLGRWRARFKSGDGLSDIFGLLLSRLSRVWSFLLLPFVFYGLKLLSPYDRGGDNPYEHYNVPQFDSFLWSPLIALKETLRLTFDVILYGLVGLDSFGLLMFILAVGVVTVMFFLLKNVISIRTSVDTVSPFSVACRKNLFYLFVFSYVLIFPYVLVGKPPALGSFVESRHFLVAQPFVFAIAVLLISNLGWLLGRFVFKPRLVVVGLLSVFVAFCAERALWVASAVWWENRISNYVIETIKPHGSNVKFWVFDNQIPEYLDATRWNYVYTGWLISAFGTKDNFGISKGEYLGWSQPVKLLKDPYYRRRYNIDDYVHQDSQNRVVIKLVWGVSANTILLMYLSELFGYKALKIANVVSVRVFKDFGCVDEAVSFFSPGKANERQSSRGEATYCQNILNAHCESIKKGAQVIGLDQMGYAYAIQQYPSILAADGLRVFDEDTDFQQVTERCSLLAGEVSGASK